jgi:hypothetical protein
LLHSPLLAVGVVVVTDRLAQVTALVEVEAAEMELALVSAYKVFQVVVTQAVTLALAAVLLALGLEQLEVRTSLVGQEPYLPLLVLLLPMPQEALVALLQPQMEP